MAREQIPVNPALITWARERAGFTPEEAAAKFKQIEAWEAGETSPTYPQLESMAEVFKLPIAAFFFPDPPELPPIAESFRTLPEAEFERIPRRIRQLLMKAKALQLNLSELCLGQPPARHLAIWDLQFPARVDVTTMARQVREYLGISIEEQMAWPSVDEAFKQWRKSLFNVGIFVFKDAFRYDEYSGFCLYDDTFPIIYVNNSSSKTRQCFTLFHEFAHLIFHTSGIDTLGNEYIDELPQQAQQIEVLCNRFAAEFLLPENELDEFLAGKEPSEQAAEDIARHFHVSREVVYRKFLARGLIDQETYTEAAERWTAQRQRGGGGGGGGNPYWTKISYLGRDYIRLALGQYHQNKIDQDQLADYLDWKPRNIDALEEYFSRGEQ